MSDLRQRAFEDVARETRTSVEWVSAVMGDGVCGSRYEEAATRYAVSQRLLVLQMEPLVQAVKETGGRLIDIGEFGDCECFLCGAKISGAFVGGNIPHSDTCPLTPFLEEK